MRSLLAIYLEDHHAAAVGGVRLARRAAASLRDGREEMEAIAREIAEDFATLERHMERLGIEPRLVKDVAGRAAELVSRLKPNGRLRGRSPLSDVLELETLVVGITGKEALWKALGRQAVLEPAEAKALVARAAAQREGVEALRAAAAARAFDPARADRA